MKTRFFLLNQYLLNLWMIIVVSLYLLNHFGSSYQIGTLCYYGISGQFDYCMVSMLFLSKKERNYSYLSVRKRAIKIYSS